MKGATVESRRPRRSPTLVSERSKIIAMGVLLALVLFAFLMPSSGRPEGGPPAINRPPAVDLVPFELDTELLGQIKDATKTERTYIEHAPWMHMMRKSYNIGPTETEALRVSEIGPAVASMRENPANYRGDFVTLKGKLVEFSEQSKMHPVPRATAYKGRLETAEGDSVVFFVSKPLADNILAMESTAWVRIEGFFMKIFDEYRFKEGDVLLAPLVIGPRVQLAYPDWKAVDKLDMNVVKRIANATWDEGRGRFVDTGDMRVMLADSQDVPLWHMASFALKEAERKAGTKLRNSVIFELKDQYTKFKDGSYEQGAAVRIRGLFIGANVRRAQTNPIGVEYWSEVWIRIPRLGAKMIPIWIPKEIGEWKSGDGVDIDALFFKNYAYEPFQGGDKHTPLFIAAGLAHFKMESHPATLWAGLGFALFVLAIALVFFQMNRRAKHESLEYKDRLVERRRNRRGSGHSVPNPQ